LIRRWLREPLLHFLLLGVLLFLAYGWLNREGFTAADEIVVSRDQVAGLRTQFQRLWQRPPTVDEEKSLIDNWVREEIYYREALAMGLERDDPVVRRRLSQKIQFILDSGTGPIDAELQAWLDEHPDRYRVESTYAMRQVYFDPARHGKRLDAVVASARRVLASGRNVEGDATMLPASLSGRAAEFERSFGREFEEALRALPVGGWQGPVRSAFGVHLVELTARSEGKAAELEDVRRDVERDLQQARAEAAQEKLYAELRARYAVRIEGEPAAAAPAG
jgi:hypothetical protein